MARILVVDDEPVSRELLVTLLGYHGHSILSACDGMEGFTLALAEQPDLIITDILMPELDGYALATRVRADPALAHIQIIFYTAIDLGTEVRQLAAESGVARIMTKPIEPETVVAIVQSVLASAPPAALHAPTSELDQAYVRQLTSTLYRNVEALKAEVQARAQAEARLRAQTARLTMLADAMHAFAAAGRGYSATINLVARTIAEALGDACAICLLPGESVGPAPIAIYDADPAALDRMRLIWDDLRLTLNKPGAQPDFVGADPLLISSADRAQPLGSARPEHWQLLDRLCAHSLIIAPLRAERRVIGLLYLARYRREQPAYTVDDLLLALDLGDRAALAIVNARLFAQLESELAERTRIEDEMRRLNAELSRSQAQLSSIIGSAMDAIITVDDHQRISIWNTAAERMFGCPLEEARGQLLDRFIPAGYRESHRDHVRSFGRTGATARAMGAQRPLTALRADGTEFPIEASISHVAIEGCQLYTVILRDTTARVQAETALRSSEERFAKAFQIGPVAMVISTVADGCILDVNHSFLRLFGRTREALIGQASMMLDLWATLAERERAVEILDRQGAVRDLEVTIHTADGTPRAVLLSADTLQLDGELCLITSLYDISERKQSELALRATSQQLQDLSRRLVALQESERRHLARELHDEIGQMLTGLNLLLETGSAFLQTALVARLHEAQAVVMDLTARVRTLSLDLRPSMLDDLGLLPALLWHFERYTSQTQVHVAFKHRGLGESLDPLIAIAVYRVVQEALTNVARYAQVGEVSVAVWTQGHQVVVSVEDQGRGFDLELALATRHSSGITGIQERVMLLGGQMMVDTAPGQGTRVLVELPLSHSQSIEEGGQ